MTILVGGDKWQKLGGGMKFRIVRVFMLGETDV